MIAINHVRSVFTDKRTMIYADKPIKIDLLVILPKKLYEVSLEKNFFYETKISQPH